MNIDLRKLGIKKRIEEQANYSSVFMDGKTIRIPLDAKKPITELHWPEFVDLSGGTFCFGGCPGCYASASTKGVNYTNLAEKLCLFFGKMTPNQRPYQAAWGGAQCVLSNPECWEAFDACKELDIIPNVTTHGITLTDQVASRLRSYSGGIAISLYRHTIKHWRKAIEVALNAGFQTNLHVIVSDKESIDQFAEYYKEYAHRVDYFVILPYKNVGFGAKFPKQVDYEYLEKVIDTFPTRENLAFGANAYGWLKTRASKYSVSIYEPEIMSKYVVLDGEVKDGEYIPSIYNNSFDMKRVPFTYENGCELGHSRTEYS